jgi:hypothetical protein
MIRRCSFSILDGIEKREIPIDLMLAFLHRHRVIEDKTTLYSKARGTHVTYPIWDTQITKQDVHSTEEVLNQQIEITAPYAESESDLLPDRCLFTIEYYEFVHQAESAQKVREDREMLLTYD